MPNDSNDVTTNTDVTPETAPVEPASNEPKPADNKPDDGVENKKEPSPQELLIEITRLKRANDKLSHENAEAKRNLKARMTEQEQLDQEKAEAEAAKDERLRELEKAAKIHEHSETLMDAGYSKEEAKKAATAYVEGDTETYVAILRNVKQAAEDAITQRLTEKFNAEKAGWLKSRPDPAQGGGDDDPFLAGFNSVPI